MSPRTRLPRPRQRRVCGGQGQGEVAGGAGEVGEAAGGIVGEAASAAGDLAHAVAGDTVLAEVAVGLGPVVEGHLGEFGGQQAGVDDAGEAGGGHGPVLVLAPGQRSQQFGQGVRGGGEPVLTAVPYREWEWLPYVVVGCTPRWPLAASR
ncbi:hypothetical protein OTB20_40380 [Streptomyces sp. H27-H1]|uniref:hypothetical protein n=1 Tax=Streptomyces sp. H27-H1 TaxID=2996461 RepID=UPI00226F403E|nr:hypothetical protein [Streptomyces sp. H27-H1]MCY0932304.1 hypothetical protein [Streptomyces sp. H27-H1]